MTAFDPMAKYGISEELWIGMSKPERNRVRNRLYRAQCKAGARPERQTFDPSRYGVTLEEWQELSPTQRRTVRDRWRYHNNPARKAAYRRRHAQRRKRYAERFREKCRARYRRKTSRETIYRQPEEVFHRIAASVPRALPAHIRDDVISSMCLAVLEGNLLVDKIASEARKYVTRFHRESGTYTALSLDAPIPGMNGMTYMDRLAGVMEE